jgi:hypothetical protein
MNTEEFVCCSVAVPKNHFIHMSGEDEPKQMVESQKTLYIYIYIYIYKYRIIFGNGQNLFENCNTATQLSTISVVRHVPISMRYDSISMRYAAISLR